MAEELYNSHDYCLLAEELEALKAELAEVTADKINLINAAMDGGKSYHYIAHDTGYRDMERKLKYLEADYAISNRELLIKQVEIDRLTAENAALREQLRWIPVSERLPEYGQDVLAYYGNDAGDDYYGVAWINPADDDKWCAYPDNPTHWLPIPPIDKGK